MICQISPEEKCLYFQLANQYFQSNFKARHQKKSLFYHSEVKYIFKIIRYSLIAVMLFLNQIFVVMTGNTGI